MAANDQDAMIAQKLSTIMSTYGFTPIQEVRKSFRLSKYTHTHTPYHLAMHVPTNIYSTDNHPLASEFLYIFDISFDTAKRIVYAVYGLSTEDEYQRLKRKWLESRKNTSSSTWWCAAGQKVVVTDQ